MSRAKWYPWQPSPLNLLHVLADGKWLSSKRELFLCFFSEHFPPNFIFFPNYWSESFSFWSPVLFLFFPNSFQVLQRLPGLYCRRGYCYFLLHLKKRKSEEHYFWSMQDFFFFKQQKKDNFFSFFLLGLGIFPPAFFFHLKKKPFWLKCPMPLAFLQFCVLV